MQTTSTNQTAALVYADVGSIHSLVVPKPMQLGDGDCVQYADIKHHRTSELHSREYNSHTGMLPQLPIIIMHVILYTVSNPTYCIYIHLF